MKLETDKDKWLIIMLTDILGTKTIWEYVTKGYNSDFSHRCLKENIRVNDVVNDEHGYSTVVIIKDNKVEALRRFDLKGNDLDGDAVLVWTKMAPNSATLEGNKYE
jgi:hypothetical protein